MNGGRFVGRVGLLAAALGVGAGLWLGQGVAYADDGGSRPSGSQQSAAGSSQSARGARHAAAASVTGGSRAPAVRARLGAEPHVRGARSTAAVSALGVSRRDVASLAPAAGAPSSPARPVTVTSLLADVLTRIGVGQLDGLALAAREAGRTLTRVSVTGNTILRGDPADLSEWLSPDKSRVVYTAGSSSATRVAVFDTSSGKQLGTTVTVPGGGVTTVAFNADGSRAMLTTPILDADTLQTTSTKWAVIDTATGKQVGSTFSLTGDGSTLLSSDGSRAVVTAQFRDWYTPDSSKVAVIDTKTGAQVGSTLTVTGTASTAVSSTGSRAVVAYTVFDSGAASLSTSVVVVDTTTGAQVGDTLSLAGAVSGTVVSSDGTRAVITSSGSDAVTGSTSTGVTVVDTDTGAQVGDTVSVAGVGSTLLTANGSRFVVTAMPYHSPFGSEDGSTSIAVVDTKTGVQVGDTVFVAGDGSTLLTANGSRAVVTATPFGSDDGPTTVVVVDTKTGLQVGEPVTVAGGGSTVLSTDGSRALVTARVFDTTVYRVTSTSWAVIDTATGDQVGSTFSLTGDGSTVLSANGSRAVVAAGVYDPAIYGVSATSWAVIDTATGDQVGSTFGLTGAGSTVLSADGSRAVLTASLSGLSSTLGSSTVAVIDTATGDQVGSTVTTLPTGAASTVLNRDGSRAVVTVRTYDPDQYSFSSTVVVINTATGNQMGSALTVTGSASTALSADGTRAVVTTDTMRVAIVDTATGEQVGSTLRIAGVAVDTEMNGLVLSADGSRALIASIPTGQAAVVNVLAAAAMIFFVPLLIFFPVLGPVVQLAQSFQAEQWTVIDTATGTGRTVTISGLNSVQFWRPPAPVMSPDGTRALVVGFTIWAPSNLFHLSTQVSTLRIS
ncbi:DNA-binding beta-propeller fold protein YncE [Mycobacterium sp. BK086]|nr:DNA-binding beta-propeller fold protein YncE [Mycobacterium sp. BK086]